MSNSKRWLRSVATSTVLGLILFAGVAPRAASQEAAAEATKPEEKKILVVGKWYPNLEAGLNLTQGSYSDNWFGGEKGTVAWTLSANGVLESQMKPKVNWRNTLKLAFGQTSQQKIDESGKRYWESPQKATDQIDFESLMRFTMGGYVDPFASFSYQSLFLDVSDPFGRKLSFNPMQFKESAGVARKFVNTEQRALLSRFGFTFRQNRRMIFNDMEEGISTATTTDMTNDGGLEWVTDYKSNVLEKKVAWSSKLTVYQPVFYSGADDLKNLPVEYLQANAISTDVADLSTRISSDWENIFTSQITKILSVGLYVRWIYDAYDNSVKPQPTPEGGLTNPEAVRGAVRKTGQFRETLSIGLTYRFL
jgi:hypothetical protein